MILSAASRQSSPVAELELELHTMYVVRMRRLVCARTSIMRAPHMRARELLIEINWNRAVC